MFYIKVALLTLFGLTGEDTDPGLVDDGGEIIANKVTVVFL